jgi:hypothetical protein
VLRLVGRPLHYKKITEIAPLMLKKRMRGKSPEFCIRVFYGKCSPLADPDA